MIAISCAPPAAPEPLATLPAFELTDQRERPFGSAELAGRVWVANAFFTRCVTICPRLTSRVRALQDRLAGGPADAVRLVSVSVDPGHDTPPRLAAYAATHGADPERWRMLTGETEQVRSLLVDGFMSHVGERREIGDGLFDIAHASRLVLVDDVGRIRGTYGTDDDALDALERDALAVLAEARRAGRSLLE